MNILSKHLIFLAGIMSINSAQGMELVPGQAKPGFVQFLFFNAMISADRGFGRGKLKLYVETAQDLNDRGVRSTYPIQDLVSNRYDSDFVVTALKRGARPDLVDISGYTLFHWIAISPKTVSEHHYACFPEQNLLSALAIPTYQYQDVVEVMEGHNEMTEEERALRSPKEVIKTFLLCLKRPEVSMLKDVKFCVLAHLIDSSCSPKLFALTIAQMQPTKVVEEFPHAWVWQIAERYTGDDRERFAKLYAPLFAHYRLAQAEKVLQIRDKQNLSPYEAACKVVDSCKNKERYNGKVIEDAQKTVVALKPEGFVERHKPKCTKIIENMLLGREPFEDFPKWQVLPVISSAPTDKGYQH